MTTFFIVASLLLVTDVIAFGLGFALGYNKAKHPEKVAAQQEAVLAEVKSIFKHKS